MNRLVIVGNGFDLANGLKSRYEDYLLDYINSAVRSASENEEGIFEDQLIIILMKEKKAGTFENFSALIEIKSQSSFILSRHSSIQQSLQTLQNNNNFPYLRNYHLRIGFKSDFLNKIISSCNWTDIEYAYFNKLKSLKDGVQIQYLNQDFEYLKSKFITYLSNVQFDYQFNEQLIPKLKIAAKAGALIASEYKYDMEQFVLRKAQSTPHLNETFFLNFNYTSLLSDFLDRYKISKSKYKVISIHGTIQEPKNIIFGYGDEMTDQFKLFQEENNPDLIKHFKSFYYANASDYFQLLGFLEQPFDVVVIGHSLGLSDRVLMNTIFENKNCQMIHLYHRGEDSHFRLRLALGRHFNDSANYRAKLMTYNPRFHLNT